MTRTKASADRPALASLRPQVKLANLATASASAPVLCTQRIRGRKLQEIRARWMVMQPLCVRCEPAGRIRASTQLDHIVALINGGADDDSNRQMLCDSCHDEKTAEDMRLSRGGGRQGNPEDSGNSARSHSRVF